MLVTCEYVPSTFASSIEVHLPSAEPVQENAALKSFKKAVSKACKQKFQQHGIPVAEKRFKVNVPLGGSWGSLPTQPIRVTGASSKEGMSPVKQRQGNEAAHDPVAEVVANAVMALPQAEKVRFVELFDVVFGDGVYESIVQGWTVQA
ncbi:hypothetical protein WJX82_008085 [Trebouxia sp. C0006]